MKNNVIFSQSTSCVKSQKNFNKICVVIFNTISSTFSLVTNKHYVQKLICAVNDSNRNRYKIKSLLQGSPEVFPHFFLTLFAYQVVFLNILSSDTFFCVVPPIFVKIDYHISQTTCKFVLFSMK